MKILVVNAGSSTHKLSLYEIHDEDLCVPLWKGTLDWGREENAIFLSANNQDGKKIDLTLKGKTIEESLRCLLEQCWQGPTQVIETPSSIEIVGHRVVHGGRQFEQPSLVTEAVKEEIQNLFPLAPLHNPGNLEGIKVMEKIFPSLPQIAVFDTAFHSHLPEVTQTYPIPYALKKEGIQRYGFHGISHQYCSERAAKLLDIPLIHLNMINCHLGNGASLCAIKNGKSIDTSMGFTPLEGLMMGTRCGSIDPGILLFLLRESHVSVEELDRLLNFDSGLKGIAGFSDMREVLEKSRENQHAKLALEMYIYRLRTFIGAYFVHLGKVNAITFTAGIGENAAALREAACRGMQFLGVDLDLDKNRLCQPDQDLATAHSKVRILAIHTQEEWMIARECWKLNKSKKHKKGKKI